LPVVIFVETYQSTAANKPEKNKAEVRPKISNDKTTGTGANKDNGPPKHSKTAKICKKINKPKLESIDLDLALKFEIAIINKHQKYYALSATLLDR
jgi:hypothetical protein